MKRLSLVLAALAVAGSAVAMPRADESGIPTAITEQPEGELSIYMRTGHAYISYFGDILATTQDETVLQMVTAPDGKTVYIQDPISSALSNYWVKGTKEGNKISIPAGQCILNDEVEGYAIEMYAGSYKEMEQNGEIYFYYEKDESIKEFTYTIGDDGVITQDAPFDSDADGIDVTADKIVTAFYTDDNSWTGYADWGSVYTPFTEKGALMPADAEINKYLLSYKYLDFSTEEYEISQKMVTVGVKDNTVYLAGVNTSEPQYCAVGTIQGDKVVFQGHQYVGLDYGYLTYFETATYEIIMVGDEDNGGYKDLGFKPIEKIELAYDAQSKSMTAQDGVAFLVMNGTFDNPMFPMDGQLLAPAYTLFNDVAAVPETPMITAFDDFYEDLGECDLQCDVPAKDVAGNSLDTEKLFYIIYTRTAGAETPYVFTADKYPGIEGKEITEIPYMLDLYDEAGAPLIGQGGIYVALFEPAADDYGIQSVYYGGGERKVSPIAWYSGDSGVKDVNVEGLEIKDVYGIDGVRRSEKVRGINIIRMSDGSVRKIMVR